jgi:hypothetical protein
MRFDSVPAADVKAEIDAAVAYFDHRPIRDFVPPLVDRPMLPRISAIRAELGVPSVQSIDALLRGPLLLTVGGEPLKYPHPGCGDRGSSALAATMPLQRRYRPGSRRVTGPSFGYHLVTQGR